MKVAVSSSARIPFAVLLCLFGLGLGGCRMAEQQGVIQIIVEKRLASPLRPSLDQFTSDLRAEGYTVSLDDTLDASVSPEAIRATLIGRRMQAPSLRGVILVGEFAAPLFNKLEREGDPYWHDHLVDLYYMDLDGAWRDRDGDGVLDEHTSFSGGLFQRLISQLVDRLPLGLDRRGPEIWLSRIRAGTLTMLGDELKLYRDYFARNHAYRTGTGPMIPPRAFVVSGGATLTESSWGARPDKLYSEVSISECESSASEALRARLADRKGWALGVIGSFSGPQVHKFHSLEGGGFDSSWFDSREGKELIAQYSMLEHKPWDVASPEIARLSPKVFFYQVLSSETGRHDQQGYLGGAYLFFGSGLAVIAGTQHSGAIGVPILYDFLAESLPVGEAWRRAIQWSQDNPGKTLTFKWCDREESWDPSADPYKAVLLGDGTLHLPRDRH